MIVELVVNISGIPQVVEGAGLHDIRGTCVTTLMSLGITSRPPKEQLRHADLVTMGFDLKTS